MKRVAFTILLNGFNHLKHNNYYDVIAGVFNEWVIVEGVSLPRGSTSWCREIDRKFHKNFLSKDGTTEFLDNNPRNNVTIIRRSNEPWDSKDAQVNAAILEIKKKYNECMLWQIDIDEQWTEDQIQQAENDLNRHGGKTGCFLCNYFVGKKQQVFGDWGEGNVEKYRRLWRWRGEFFKSHEPPVLNGKNGPGFLLSQRFNHYAYYFEDDIKFKEEFYGYKKLYERWKEIQSNEGILHISKLLGNDIPWGRTNTIIKKI